MGETVRGILEANHLLVEFFPGTNAYYVMGSVRRNCTSNISHFHRRNLFYIDFTTDHIFEAMPNKSNALLQSYHETSHFFVSYR